MQHFIVSSNSPVTKHACHIQISIRQQKISKIYRIKLNSNEKKDNVRGLAKSVNVNIWLMEDMLRFDGLCWIHNLDVLQQFTSRSADVLKFSGDLEMAMLLFNTSSVVVATPA